MNTIVKYKFEEMVEAMVAGFGYSLENIFTNDDEVRFDSKDKKVYIVPMSYLNNADFASARENAMPYAVIGFNRSSEENYEKNSSLVFFDETQSNTGVVKIIDATCFSLEYADNIPCLMNLFYHHAYPGDDKLKYDMCEDDMDYMSDNWDEYVKMVSVMMLEKNNYSWLPSDYCYNHYLPMKDGFKLIELYHRVNTIGSFVFMISNSQKNILDRRRIGKITGKVLDSNDLKKSCIDYRLDADDIPSDREYEGQYYIISKIEDLTKKYIVVSLEGHLRPTLIEASENPIYVPLSSMVVIEFWEDEFDADYLVKELQKDYVERQFEERQRRVSGDRDYILSLIKIYVPLATNERSSIELQKEYAKKEYEDYINDLKKELAKERMKNLKEYKDILDYCQDEHLINLLEKLKNDEISDDITALNEIRKILEWVRDESSAFRNKFMKECDNTSLNHISRDIIDKSDEVPEYIKRSFHLCVSISNKGSHFLKKDKDMNKEYAPYMAKSVMFCLLNILYWCKGLDNNN